MRFTELFSACLIVFLFLAGSATVSPWLMRIVPRTSHSANALQTISNLQSEFNPHELATDQTRVSQNVPSNDFPSEQVQIERQWQGFHLQSFALSNAPSAIVSPNAPPPVVWDEQLGTSFTQDFTSLSYNVTAIEQADVDGYGPAYLLNGLSDNGYWYQVGISWNWPNIGSGYVQGFHLNYEVFNSRGNSIFPRSGGGGLDDFAGTVNGGDTVLLSLYFSSGNVVMYGFDFNTNASAQESYSAVGASRFVGTPNSVTNLNGFFTGLMTEWYHAFEYFGDEAPVLYSNPTVALSSGWMWIDEFDPDNGTSLFSASTPSPISYSNQTQLHHFSSNGATEASNAYSFISGTADLVSITLSYSIVGGGTNYVPPSLTYFFGGTLYNTTFSTSPAIYYVDSGSVWNASNLLSGSSSTEMWTSNETTNGVANSFQTINIVYYHQYLVNLGYTVSGAGTGYSPPDVTFEQFGETFIVVPPASVFIDAESQCLYQDLLVGSNSTTRWQNASNASITVSSSTNMSLTYFLQYSLIASYSVSSGNGYAPPSLYGTQFGDAYAPTLLATPTTYWLDSGTSWSVDNVLTCPENSEQWIITATASGTIDSPSSASPSYLHQYGFSVYVSIVGSEPGYFPQFDFVSNGSAEAITLSGSSQKAWADEGTVWSISPNPLIGLNSSVRWDSQDILLGTVSVASTINPTYYHQYAVTTSYSVSGGENPTAPSITSKLFGRDDSFSVTISPTMQWLDEGASWTLTNPLIGSSATERWFTSESSTTGTVSSTTTLSFVFDHQFYVDLKSNVVAGGSIVPASDWFNAGQQIQISAVSHSGWQFENWNGSGTGSYSGTVNQSSVTVDSAIVENATFYIGLTISGSGFGTVTYDYGSDSGSVSTGSSKVLYVPLNANVSLTANPSFYVFNFEQWSGAINSVAQRVSITATAPTALQANFGYDWFNVVITIAVIAVTLILIVSLLLSRKRNSARSQRALTADEQDSMSPSYLSKCA
jgi:Divergent InlB B-repeat domain